MLLPADIQKTKITDPFWGPKIHTAETVGIPYMFRAFNNELPDAPKSYCLHNFRVAAGLEAGEFGGQVFQDSDLYKYIEAVGYYLAGHTDAQTEFRCDSIIELIAKAQLADGYVNTYFIINGIDGRWTNLAENHELYCAGHLMEAACAYCHATGKRTLLDVACRFADHIDAVFGPELAKCRGYPGHQEVEIGLLKLYEATGCERYLQLAEHFLLTRGQQPLYFDEERGHMPEESLRHNPQWSSGGEPYTYMQAHRPLLQQDAAVGHAVRANYMYAAAAHLAGLTDNKALLEHMVKLWENITNKRMYITGGVGSMIYGEAYTLDYDLPNDMMYNETCASIALAMFSMRLLNATGQARYADIVEKSLYNGILSGQQLDGTKYFYVNPMSVWRQRCLARIDMEPIKPQRQGWFNCACCPPNILRTLTGLAQYIYSYTKDSILANLYVQGESEFPLEAGTVRLEQRGNYPWDGHIALQLHLQAPTRFTLGMRIPGWCRGATATYNGQALDVKTLTQNGYLTLEKTFCDGDVVELHLALAVEIVRSHPSVPFNSGKVALQRGPLVYCLEDADNAGDLWNLLLDTTQPIACISHPELLGGIDSLHAHGIYERTVAEGALYTTGSTPQADPCILQFIPYYAWCNRSPGNMTVWVRERRSTKICDS